MKDIHVIAGIANIPEDFFKGSLGITTLLEESTNPSSYYHRLTPIEKRIMDMPALDESITASQVRYFYYEYLNKNTDPDFFTAVLTKWIMVASTLEELLEPFEIAFNSKFYDIAQTAVRKIYALA